jgi:hypothetical protein
MKVFCQRCVLFNFFWAINGQCVASFLTPSMNVFVESYGILSLIAIASSDFDSAKLGITPIRMSCNFTAPEIVNQQQII